MESAKISWVHFSANVLMEHMEVHPQKMVVLLQKRRLWAVGHSNNLIPMESQIMARALYIV